MYFQTAPQPRAVRKLPHILPKTIMTVLLAVVCIFAMQAHALELFNKPAAKFLPVGEAFQTIPRQENDTLAVDFVVTPKHYIYEQRVKLKLADGGEITPKNYNLQPTFVDDPEFGRVPVFEQNVRATFVLPAGAPAQDAKLKWQGCAKAGLCYPPVTETVALKAVGKLSTQQSAQQPAQKPAEQAADNAAKSNATKNNTLKAASNANTNTDVNTNADADSKAAQQKQQGDNGSAAKTVVTNTQQRTAPITTNKPTSKIPAQSTQKTTAQKTATQKTAAQATPAEVTTAPLTTTTLQSQELAAVELDNANIEPTGEQAAERAGASDQTSVANTNHFPNSAVDDAAANALHAPSNPNNSRTSSLDAAVNPDPFGLAHNKFLGVLLLFLAGLGLAFTPCVLPMLPIVANIVANEHKLSARHGFLLTLSYGVGIATAYGLLGAIVSVVGRQYIIHAMQSPVVLVGFALLFVFLALYLLDIIKVRLPSSFSQFLHRLSARGQGGIGGYVGSGVAGFFSAIVVSPCVTAPLVGALAGVASVGEPVFGFVALFCLGFGLSVPLIILGTFEAKLLPTAGEWMNWVKHGFALLLFGVAILLLARVYDSSVILLLWGVLTAAIAAWFWLFPNKASGKWQKVTRALALGFGFWAALQLVGAALGNTSPVRPLQNLIQTNVNAQPQKDATQAASAVKQLDGAGVPVIRTLAELDTAKARHDHLIVDVFADWCVECKIMDKNLFEHPPEQMAGWQMVKLDITEASDDAKAVIEHLNIFGPPVLVFYQDGKMVALRHGETKRMEFEAVLDELNR